MANELPNQNIKRNFPGVKKQQYYSLADLQKGDLAGITETDSKTSGKKDGDYTSINSKSGKSHNG